MKLLRSLLDLFYPPLCALCEGEAEAAVCGGCVDKMDLIHTPSCARCGAAKKGKACAECIGRTFTFQGAVAVGKYEGTLRDLLLNFKLGGNHHLARDLGRRQAQRVLDESIPVDLVTFVPMRRSSQLRRGYNPAEELAVCLASALRRPYARALRKVRPTRPQATLAQEERLKNPQGAYRIEGAARLKGRSVVLVDDVLTTGATANECSRVLMEAGSREVHLAVVGR